MEVFGLASNSTNDQLKARAMVMKNINESCVKRGLDLRLSLNDVYIVSFMKILNTWQAVVGSNIATGLFYIVSRDDNSNKTHMEIFEKVKSVCLEDEAD